MFGQGKQTHIDSKKLSVFVHDVRVTETHDLCQKVWETNARNIVQDQANKKDLLRFVFSNPTCIVWLQRDIGQTDSSEMVLLWDDAAGEPITEVYVVSKPESEPRGDSTRATQLLNAILSSPATVPATS